jgi:hypothetical protein
MSNQPFIKANYPHHEGVWGWGKEADQVMMVVRNMRRSLVEYHDILWDLGYAKTFHEAHESIEKMYTERPPKEDFLAWRDVKVMDEVHWYGWFIDYYMEAGLMRDIFTHKITTPEHWYMLMQPTRYTKAETEFDQMVGYAVVKPSYDPHCVYDISGGCFPIKIISAEKLVKADTGPAEGRKIAKVLQQSPGFQDHLIGEEAWECIWTELIVNKKGLKTFIDREGITEQDYNFSTEMLDEMIGEFNRLISKYSRSEWTGNEIAQDLVALLQEHLALIVEERDEVLSGARKLKDTDILGPETRKQRFSA